MIKVIINHYLYKKINLMEINHLKTDHVKRK